MKLGIVATGKPESSNGSKQKQRPNGFFRQQRLVYLKVEERATGPVWGLQEDGAIDNGKERRDYFSALEDATAR